ncbi:hypothetical protein [Paenibacillus montanisoli]|uniref:hypothetical protein n=1 Tax=Paenibacillus montanisoli TaxID=2081970 RepID=UPI001402B5FE|nr:hypothetical protein [Paenibacillus montanisoli]
MDQGHSDVFSAMLPANLARIKAILGQNSDFITREITFKHAFLIDAAELFNKLVN